MDDDRRAIEEVLIDYATAIDTKDWVLFRACFTEDCVMTSAAGSVRGADELTRHMGEMHAPLDSSLHRISNISTQLSGDTARAHSYLDALLVRADHPDGPTFRVFGTYDDRLARQGSGPWVIQERTFVARWREGNPRVLSIPPPPMS